MMVLVDFYSIGNLTFFISIELMFPIFTSLIFVTSGDSSGISVTGETPQERVFRDEEAHRTPHGKRPIVTKISADQYFISIHQRHILYNPKNTAYRINTCRRCFGFIDQSTTKYLASGCANTIAETDASGSIMNPSVNSTPISSGLNKPNNLA